MYVQMNRYYMYCYIVEMNRQMEIQIDKWKYKQIDRDTNRQMEIQIDRWRYKKIDGDTNNK